MKIREHEDRIELVAQDIRETKLLSKLFAGMEGKRYHKYSFGYDRKMPRRTKELADWAKKQVLVFKREE